MRTCGAEPKASHRCAGTVVRQRSHNRETWSTVGAVDERVPKSSIPRIVQLAQALITDTNVWRNTSDGSFVLLAFKNLKGTLVHRRRDANRYNVSNGRRSGGFCQKPSLKLVDTGFGSLNLDCDTTGLIENESRATQFCRQSPNKRSEADSLDNTTNSNTIPRDAHPTVPIGASRKMADILHQCLLV